MHADPGIAAHGHLAAAHRHLHLTGTSLERLRRPRDPLAARQQAPAAQLRSLTELRLDIEPIAAHLANLRATDEQRAELRATAEAMRRYGNTHRPVRYLAADIEFHRILLEASGNEMYTALADPIVEVLKESPRRGRSDYPVPEAIGYHEAVMEAVCAADPDLAERSMVTLLRDVRSALNLV